MNELLAAAFFWSLLAVPMVFWIIAVDKKIPGGFDAECEVPTRYIPHYLCICVLWIVVFCGFAFDVLPRLYAVLMEMAK